MNDELRELVINENVPMSLVEEFSSKVKALKDKAEKLNSAMRETRSFGVKLEYVEQMTQLLEKRIKAEEDFVEEARKYVKKGGAGDEDK